MQTIEKFTFGNFYHVYNKGVDGCDIFRENRNYEYFLKLYEKYLSLVIDTIAWVLMPNHFHFALRVRSEEEINKILNERTICKKSEVPKIPDPSKQLSNFFNAYAQAFNKAYERKGNLFQRPFKRKLVEDNEYLKTIIVYIHNNPVHHGFCSMPAEYVWSSFFQYVKCNANGLKEYFEGIPNFIDVHKKDVEKGSLNLDNEVF